MMYVVYLDGIVVLVTDNEEYADEYSFIVGGYYTEVKVG